MKTTLELPDQLFAEAKATAALRRVTLKELFTRALEKEIHPPAAPAEDSHFTIDEYGWPILNRETDCGVVITQELIDRIREEEGI